MNPTTNQTINQRINDAAVHGISASGFDTRPHHCQKWVRQVVQSVAGSQYDEFWQATARATALAFLDDGRFVVPLDHGSLPGDLLYKLNGSGGDGHVGIRVRGNQVAENASCHWNSEAEHPDARGYRTLVEFGHYDVVVRLP
ncbi:MAG: hypothetical protein JO316_14130 [Abitibacteriaceae bacterium]|nr:hypothetical protein [Abditibacteriaceae bacterium]MBV9866487.1 hypothetical protein [Abditibacteriaceae bacterium]